MVLGSNLLSGEGEAECLVLTVLGFLLHSASARVLPSVWSAVAAFFADRWVLLLLAVSVSVGVLGVRVDAAVCVGILFSPGLLFGPLYTFASVTCLFSFRVLVERGLDAGLLLFYLVFVQFRASLGGVAGKATLLFLLQQYNCCRFPSSGTRICSFILGWFLRSFCSSQCYCGNRFPLVFVFFYTRAY